jgi:hypothetical protein
MKRERERLNEKRGGTLECEEKSRRLERRGRKERRNIVYGEERGSNAIYDLLRVSFTP